MLHKENELHLLKKFLQVIPGSVMSCEISSVNLVSEMLRLFLLSFTRSFNLVMLECQEMNLICNP